MTSFKLFLFSSLLIFTSISSNALAAIYKCADENGGITYSKSPCNQNQKTNKVINDRKKLEDMEDCKYAGLFSKLVFRQMRHGINTLELFDRYGGVNSISKSTLGIINYVYSFKLSTATQSSRVALLTIAKCNSQAFGKVLCEDFPKEFQKTIYSCDDEEREEAIRLQKMINQSVGQQYQFNDYSNIERNIRLKRGVRTEKLLKAQEKREQKRREKGFEQARTRKCQRYESDIEYIENRMSQKYTISEGEKLRDRRRKLNRKISKECR